MSARLDDLIEALKAEGRVDSKGRFTLDREKARSKMQRFQLAEPLHYLLLLVEAAALKGATHLRFDIDTDDMHLRFDGDPFTREDFDRLYEALLGEDGGTPGPAFAARQALAIGLNAASALTPERITVTSGDGERGARLTVTADGADEFGDLQPAPTETHVQLKEPLGSVSAGEIVRWMTGKLAEVEILKDRCRYGQRRITVNGAEVARGLYVPEALIAVPIVGETFEGLVGLLAHDVTPSTMDVVKDDVWITTHALADEGLPGGLRATVHSGAFTKDVSQRNVVKDAAWAQVVEAVRGAEPALWHGLALRHDDPADVLTSFWIEERVRRALAAGRPGAAQAALGLPLWRDRTKTPIHTVALIEHLAAEAPVAFIEGEDPAAHIPKGEDLALPYPFVIRLGLDARDALEQLAAARDLPAPQWRDARAELEAAAIRWRNHHQWRLRRRSPDLEGIWCLHSTPLEGPNLRDPNLRGVIGLRGAEAHLFNVKLIVDGCLLGERSAPCPLPGLIAVVEAELTPDDDFGWAEPDEALEAAAEALERGVYALIDGLADALRADLTGRDADSARAAVIRALGAPTPWSEAIREILGLPISPTFQPSAEGFSAAVGRCPLMLSAAGDPVSLDDLQAIHDAGLPIRWVEDTLPIITQPAGPLAVRLPLTLRAVLRARFGPDALTDVTGDYARRLGHSRHLEKPTYDARPGGEIVREIALKGAVGGQPAWGVARLVRPPKIGWWGSRATLPRFSLALCHSGRLLTQRVVSHGTPIGGGGPFEVWLDTEGLTPTPGWDGVERDDREAEALAVVHRGLAELICALALEGDLTDALVREATLAGARHLWIPPADGPLPGFTWTDDAGEAMPAAALWRSPILARATAQGDTRPISPAEVEAGVEAGVEAAGETLVHWLPAPSRDRALDEVLVLVGDGDWLGAIFGADRVAPAGPWLARRARLGAIMARPRQTAGLLGALVEAPVAHGDITGQVGLARADRAPGEIELRVEGRTLHRLRWPDLPGVVAWLEIPLGLLADDLKTPRDEAPLKAAVEASLADAWRALDAALLSGEVPFSDPAALAHGLAGISSRLSAGLSVGQGEALAGLRRLALFTDLQGRRWSTAELAARIGEGPAMVVSPGLTLPDPCLAPSDLQPWLTERVVLVCDAPRRQALGALFGEPAAVDSAIRAALMAHARQAEAAPAPARPAEHSAALTWPGGEGWVALDLDALGERQGIALCRHGAVIDALDLHPHLPCFGAASGADVEVEEGWRAAGLSAAVRQRLTAAAAQLYRDLVEGFDDQPSADRQRAVAPLRRWISTHDRLDPPEDLPEIAETAWRRAVDALPLITHPLCATLASALGAGASLEGALRWGHRVERWLRQVSVTPFGLPGLPDEWLGAPLTVRWPQGQAVVGVPRRALDEASGIATVSLRWQSRPLSVRRRSTLSGAYTAVVEDARIAPAFDLEGPLPGPDLDGALEDTQRALPHLIGYLARQHLPAARLWLTASLRAYLPDPICLRALALLLDDAGEGDDAQRAALAVYADLLSAVEADPDALAAIGRRRTAKGLVEARDLLGEIPPSPLLDGGVRVLRDLFDAPLLPIAGPKVAGEGPWCSLADALRAYQRVGCVYLAQPVRCPRYPARLILTPDEDLAPLIRLVFGSAQLSAADDWLREARRAWAMAALPVAHIALDDDEALVTIEIGDPSRRGMEGVVGLAARFRLTDDDLVDPEGLRAYRDGRLLGHGPGPEPGMLAAIEDARLSLDADLDGVAEGPDLDRVIRRCRRQRPALIEQIVARWDQLDEADQATALDHVLYTLSRQGSHRALQTAAGQAVAELPCLPTVTGERVTIQQAAASRAEEGALYFMTEQAPPGERPIRPDRVVLWIPTPVRQEALRRIYGALTDYADRWAADQDAHRRRAALSPLRVPDDVALSLPLTARDHGLDGAIFLPRSGPLTVTLGKEGLALTEIEPLGLFPASAVISGPKVEVDEGWRQATLTDSGRRALEQAGQALYAEMAAQYDRWAKGDQARLDDPNADPPPIAAARRALIDAGLRSRAALARGQLNRATARLYEQTIAALPLLWPHGDSRRRLKDVKALDEVELRAHLDASARFYDAPARPLGFAAYPWLEVPFEGGQIGVPYADDGATHVQHVWRHGRPLDLRRAAQPVGPVVALVNANTATPDRAWRRLDAADDLAAVDAATWRGLAPLINAVVARLASGEPAPPGPRAFILRATRQLAPTPAWLQWAAAFEALHPEDPDACPRAWVKLMRLTARRGVAAIDEILRRRLERGAALDVQAIEGDHDGPAAEDQQPDRAAPGDTGAGPISPTLVASTRSLWRGALWPTADAPLSLMALCAQWQAEGHVIYAGPGAPAKVTPGGSHVIQLGADLQRQDLVALLGNDALLDAGSHQRRLAAQDRFEAQPQAEIPALDAAEILVEITSHRGQARGVIALPTPHPRRDSVTLTLYRDQRRAGLAYGEHVLRGRALVGVIDHPALPMSADFTAPLGLSADDPVSADLRSLIADAPEALMIALHDAWPDLDPASRLEAGRHLLDHLAVVGIAAPTPRLRALMARSCLPTVGGELRSVGELIARQAQRGQIPYLPAPPAADLDVTSAPFGPPSEVLILDAHYLSRLRDLSRDLADALTDVSGQWAQAALAERRHQQAPPLPTRPEALAHRLIDEAGLKGELWIPRPWGSDLTIALGHQGRARGAWSVIPPIAGAVEGAPLDDGGAPRPDAAQRASLDDGALRLYRAVARDLPGLDGAARQQAAEALAGAAIQLRGLERREGQSMIPALRALLDDLYDLPIFAVEGGASISLASALRERPHALSHLGLWLDDGPKTATNTEKQNKNTASEGGTPTLRALAGVRQTLRRVRGGNLALLSDDHLDQLRFRSLGPKAPGAVADEGGCTLNRDHPRMKRVLVRARKLQAPDPLEMAWVASMIYTALNHFHGALTDADELTFHRLLALDLVER